MDMFYTLCVFCGFVCVSCCFIIPNAHGENHVLYLDGDGAYVHLPLEVFNKLNAATVEGWVRWEKLLAGTTVFDFGQETTGMSVSCDWQTPTHLRFQIRDKYEKYHRITVLGILSEAVWMHIAAVSGNNGMKIYVNGILVGEDAYEGSFSEINSGDNYLGKSNWSDPTAVIEIDEFRVWNRARTGIEIQKTMFTSLRGDEPGLVGYWSFEGTDERAIDGSGNGHHGEMIAGAKGVARKTPMPDTLHRVLLTNASKQLDFKTGTLRLAIKAQRSLSLADFERMPVSIELRDGTGQLLLTTKQTEGNEWVWKIPQTFDGEVKVLSQLTDAESRVWRGARVLQTRQFAQHQKKELWRTYSTIDGLPSNAIYAIFQAKDGALWFGTGGGISRFDATDWTTYYGSWVARRPGY